MNNNLNNKVTFYELRKSSPEAYSESYEPLHTCFAKDYNISEEDFNVLGASSNQKVVNITIRNNLKDFTPQEYHLFELHYGFFKKVKFNVIKIQPLDFNQNYLKILGKISGN